MPVRTTIDADGAIVRAIQKASGDLAGRGASAKLNARIRIVLPCRPPKNRRKYRSAQRNVLGLVLIHG